MKQKRPFISIPAAILAAVVMLAAAPLHAAHTHGDDGESVTLHSPCAVCLVHAPAGTPPDAGAVIVEPDCFSHFFRIHTDVLLPSAHGQVDACRAPPALLAA
jgi:hypothetical protein